MGGEGHKEGRIPPTSHQPSNLRVLKETQVKVQVQLHKALAAPHGRDEDDAAFLTLELLHGAHLEVRDRPAIRGSWGRGSRGKDAPCLGELELQGCAEKTPGICQSGGSEQEREWGGYCPGR